ncbi:unnamed protein product [Amoebophrya sp. A120]|nr:unnamed protein product [Amoebophrya sp. A120]|eukprot:GSA120T00012255001.1
MFSDRISAWPGYKDGDWYWHDEAWYHKDWQNRNGDSPLDDVLKDLKKKRQEEQKEFRAKQKREQEKQQAKRRQLQTFISSASFHSKTNNMFEKFTEDELKAIYEDWWYDEHACDFVAVSSSDLVEHFKKETGTPTEDKETGGNALLKSKKHRLTDIIATVGVVAAQPQGDGNRGSSTSASSSTTPASIVKNSQHLLEQARDLTKILTELLNLEEVFEDTRLEGLLDSLLVMSLASRIKLDLGKRISAQRLMNLQFAKELLQEVVSAPSVVDHKNSSFDDATKQEKSPLELALSLTPPPTSSSRRKIPAAVASSSSSPSASAATSDSTAPKGISITSSRKKKRRAWWFVPPHHRPMGSWTLSAFQNKFDRRRLDEAVAKLIDRHETLRGHFPENLRVLDLLNEPSVLLQCTLPGLNCNRAGGGVLAASSSSSKIHGKNENNDKHYLQHVLFHNLRQLTTAAWQDSWPCLQIFESAAAMYKFCSSDENQIEALRREKEHDFSELTYGEPERLKTNVVKYLETTEMPQIRDQLEEQPADGRLLQIHVAEFQAQLENTVWLFITGHSCGGLVSILLDKVTDPDDPAKVIRHRLLWVDERNKQIGECVNLCSKHWVLPPTGCAALWHVKCFAVDKVAVEEVEEEDVAGENKKPPGDVADTTTRNKGNTTSTYTQFGEEYDLSDDRLYYRYSKRNAVRARRPARHIWFKLENQGTLVVYDADPFEDKNLYYHHAAACLVPGWKRVEVDVGGENANRVRNEKINANENGELDHDLVQATEDQELQEPPQQLPSAVSFMTLRMYHSVGDAFTYYPLVNDLLALYSGKRLQSLYMEDQQHSDVVGVDKKEQRQGERAASATASGEKISTTQQCKNQSSSIKQAAGVNEISVYKNDVVAGDHDHPMHHQIFPKHFTTEELQQRLWNAFTVDPVHLDIPRDRFSVEHRYSLRGVSFADRGRGLDHDLWLDSDAVKVLKLVSTVYGVPLEVVLVGLMMMAEARASRVEYLESTLYVPQRDSNRDNDAVGLFVDWRDLALQIPLESATFISVLLDLHQKIRNRDWQVFNPVTSHDRTLVNFQILDKLPRGSRPLAMTQVPDSVWYSGKGGYRLGGHGPISRSSGHFHVAIKQIAEHEWVIGLTIDLKKHDFAWLRRVIRGFQFGLEALLCDPTRKVHVNSKIDEHREKQHEQRQAQDASKSTQVEDEEHVVNAFDAIEANWERKPWEMDTEFHHWASKKDEYYFSSYKSSPSSSDW